MLIPDSKLLALSSAPASVESSRFSTIPVDVVDDSSGGSDSDPASSISSSELEVGETPGCESLVAAHIKHLSRYSGAHLHHPPLPQIGVIPGPHLQVVVGAVPGQHLVVQLADDQVLHAGVQCSCLETLNKPLVSSSLICALIT